jgi:hypothetical protein
MAKRQSLPDAEREALKVLEPELFRHGKLTEDAFNLIGVTLGRVPEQPFREISLPQKVTTSLLIQISNDLASSSMLAFRGYAVQSVTIVSSMFETSYCIATIGSDQAMAQRWADHDDPTRPFMKVKDMIICGLRNFDHPDPKAQAEIEYRVYRQLCMAKHSNPLFQMLHGYFFSRDEVIAMNGPNTSENFIRASWFALEHAAAVSFIALMSFITNHLSVKENKDLLNQVVSIGDRREELENLGKKRWGTVDPFPGKW